MALRRQLQRAQAASRPRTAQAEQLLAYRRDYEQRWSAQFCREGTIELVRCYQGFIERLTQAVEQQERVAEHADSAARARAPRSLREHEMRVAVGAQADRAPRRARCAAAPTGASRSRPTSSPRARLEPRRAGAAPATWPRR